MNITYYSSNPVPVEYSEEEMKKVISDYLRSVKEEFSFHALSDYIVDRAIKEGKVANAASTQYSSNKMTPSSSIIVSKILWNYIWNQKVFIAFGENPYTANYKDDTRFVVVK